jgi:hypothetical protein
MYSCVKFTLTPMATEPTKGQYGKISRAYKKAGIENADRALIINTVGGFLAAGLDAVTYTSRALARSIKESADQLLGQVIDGDSGGDLSVKGQG